MTRQQACTGCRFVRLKCERPPEAPDNCVRCLEKGLQCVPWKKAPRKPYERKGVRQQQVQRLFGHQSADAEPISLSPSATSNQLVTLEYEGALSSSLLDVYLRSPSSTSGMLETLQLRQRFESAGRRVTQLDPETSSLLHVVLALAARVSDHPLLIGGAPPSADYLLQAVQDGYDLSAWGLRRKDACEALEKRAVECVDQNGIWRKASLTTLAVMMLLEGVLESSTASRDESRPYAQGSLSILKELIERAPPSNKTKAEELDELRSTDMAWAAFVKAGAYHAMEGRPIPFDKRHEDALAVVDAPSVSDILASPLMLYSVDAQLSYWIAQYAFTRHIIDTARRLSDRVTNARAIEAGRVDLEAAREILKRNDEGAAMLPIMDAHLERTLCADAQIDGVMNLRIKGQGSALRVTRCGQVLLLHRYLAERAAASPLLRRDVNTDAAMRVADIASRYSGKKKESREPVPDASDTAYWTELQELFIASQDRSISAVLEIVSHLKRNLVGGASMGILSGSYITLKRLPIWLSFVIYFPPLELGGTRPDLTFAAKRDMLQTCIKCLASVSWSFPKLAEPLPWLRTELEKLNRDEAIYNLTRQSQPSTTLMDAPSSLFDSSLSVRHNTPNSLQEQEDDLLQALGLDSSILDDFDAGNHGNPFDNSGVTNLQGESLEQALQELHASLGFGVSPPDSESTPSSNTSTSNGPTSLSTARTSTPATPAASAPANRASALGVDVVTSMFSRLLQ